MHSVVRLLAVMSIGALSQALATEPEHPASTSPASAQASSQPQAAATPADQQPSSAKAPTAASSTTAAAATPGDKTTAASGKLSPELIKKAHDMGYKIKHKGQDVYFCRNEAQMGSRFEKEACSTPEQLDLVARQTQQMVEKAQRIGMPPVH
jgi:hypothetical protein